MTPTQFVDFVRKRYNIVGDTFWSDDEILGYLYDASMQLSREAQVIERIYTTSTVAGTREYSYPTNTIAIKRVTWNGQKLQPISFREDDALTGLSEATTSQGDPQFYAVWNSVIYLRPIPSSVQTLKLYTINEPQTITTTSTLEIPTQYHTDMADYVIAMLAMKEQNFQSATWWLNRWDARLQKIKMWERKKLRRDGFTNVVDINTMNESFLGMV